MSGFGVVMLHGVLVHVMVFYLYQGVVRVRVQHLLRILAVVGYCPAHEQTLWLLHAGLAVSGAVSADGRAWLWGFGTNSQLGKGDDDGDEEVRSPPLQWLIGKYCHCLAARHKPGVAVLGLSCAHTVRWLLSDLGRGSG